MTTIDITLKDEHDQFIRDSVKAGSFTSKSEVVATALDMLKSRDELRRARRAQLKGEVEKGIAQLDRGETADFDLKRFLADSHAKGVLNNA